MDILSIVAVATPIVVAVLNWFGKKKAAKEVLILSTGIEKFCKSESDPLKRAALKTTIRKLAEESGIEKRLNKKIKKFQDRLWKKIL